MLDFGLENWREEVCTTIGAQRRWTDWEIKSLRQIAQIAQMDFGFWMLEDG